MPKDASFRLSACHTLAALPGAMASDGVARVFAALQAKDADPQVLFVGGCVRNAVLGVAVTDIDLATRLLPTEVTEHLAACGIRVLPTGIAHGTVTALVDGAQIEITTLRRDMSTDGRHATVDFTADWVEDARRRDFTINTLLADETGRIYDPLGQGLGDLAAGRVRFVGTADERVAEDYLRILRFFRFHAAYGRGPLDADGLAAAIRYAEWLKELSKERVTQEILKLIVSPGAPYILKTMRSANILEGWPHPTYSAKHLKILMNINISEKQIAAMIIAAGFSPEGLKTVQSILRLPNAFLNQCDKIVGLLNAPIADDDHFAKLALYRLGTAKAPAALACRMIRNGAAEEEITTALNHLSRMSMPVMPFSGNDLIADGIMPGPAMGRRLRQIERLWIEAGLPERSDFQLPPGFGDDDCG